MSGKKEMPAEQANKLTKRGFLRHGAEILLFLILAGVLIFALQLIPQGNPPSGKGSAASSAYPPYPPPGEARATPTPTAVKPPPCKFSGGAAPEASGPTLDDYVFSEPQVVLTSTTALGIASWLPDSERLLITRQTMNGQQTIETFNYLTGETIIYAERDGEHGKPIWINELNAIAYATSVQDHYELWIGYRNIQENARIASDASGWSLATDGKRLVYFSPAIGDIPQIWDSNTKVTRGTGIDLTKWEYPKFPNSMRPPVKGKTFETALQPNGALIAFYGYGWFFLLDETTKQICEIDLEQYGAASLVLRIAWSPDGRFIAMIVTPNYPGELVSSSNILVLDLVSGKTRSPVLESPVVRDIAWSDNSQFLAALSADLAEFQNGSPLSKIYVIDIFDDRPPKAISAQLFGGGATNGWLLAWSPNGKVISVKCPTLLETEPTIAQDNICIIEVFQKP